MNSTTLPPLKPRSNKLYGGVASGVNPGANMNATIATTGMRNGRASSSSTGIQVQQMYDTTSTQQKTYFTTTNNNTTNMNASNNNISNGAKSPSGDSMHSNKSLMQTAAAQSNKQSNSQSNLSAGGGGGGAANNQSGMNSSQQQARRIQPMSPETAMKNYMQKLTTFEHHEIFNYSDIFFIGQNAKKINGVIGGTNNNGYDDENGSYKPVQHDQIYYRFEVNSSYLFYSYLNKLRTLVYQFYSIYYCFLKKKNRTKTN
jgi:hypothetical protein